MQVPNPFRTPLQFFVETTVVKNHGTNYRGFQNLFDNGWIPGVNFPQVLFVSQIELTDE